MQLYNRDCTLDIGSLTMRNAQAILIYDTKQKCGLRAVFEQGEVYYEMTSTARMETTLRVKVSTDMAKTPALSSA